MSIIATGGTVSDITVGGIPYKLHAITSNATFTIVSADAGDTFEVLGAAPGASGGVGGTSTVGGGGGAGEFRIRTGLLASSFMGANSIVIGSPGAGHNTANTRGNQGGDLTAFGFTWLGGGAGGSGNTLANGLKGADGGSGGGGGGRAAGAGTAGGASTAGGLGNDGGAGYDSSTNDERAGGGGGGAGTDGVTATAGVAGAGGNGYSSNFTGSTVTYCPGGGGASRLAGTPGAGGSSGGGAGEGASAATSGTAFGAGGGGARGGVSGSGGAGVIYVRYVVGQNADASPAALELEGANSQPVVVGVSPANPLQIEARDAGLLVHFDVPDDSTATEVIDIMASIAAMMSADMQVRGPSPPASMRVTPALFTGLIETPAPPASLRIGGGPSTTLLANMAESASFSLRIAGEETDFLLAASSDPMVMRAQGVLSRLMIDLGAEPAEIVLTAEDAATLLAAGSSPAGLRLRGADATLLRTFPPFSLVIRLYDTTIYQRSPISDVPPSTWRKHLRKGKAQVHDHLSVPAIYALRPDGLGRLVRVRPRFHQKVVGIDGVDGGARINDAELRILFDQVEVARPMVHALVFLGPTEAYKVHTSRPAYMGYVEAEVTRVPENQASTLWGVCVPPGFTGS